MWAFAVPTPELSLTERRATMATKDSSGGQERKATQRDEADEVAEVAATDLQERVGKLTDDVDALLDDIDATLEENAEDFVKAFVQKGGE